MATLHVAADSDETGAVAAAVAVVGTAAVAVPGFVLWAVYLADKQYFADLA